MQIRSLSRRRQALTKSHVSVHVLQVQHRQWSSLSGCCVKLLLSHTRQRRPYFVVHVAKTRLSQASKPFATSPALSATMPIRSSSDHRKTSSGMHLGVARCADGCSDEKLRRRLRSADWSPADPKAARGAGTATAPPQSQKSTKLKKAFALKKHIPKGARLMKATTNQTTSKRIGLLQHSVFFWRHGRVIPLALVRPRSSLVLVRQSPHLRPLLVGHVASALRALHAFRRNVWLRKEAALTFLHCQHLLYSNLGQRHPLRLCATQDTVCAQIVARVPRRGAPSGAGDRIPEDLRRALVQV